MIFDKPEHKEIVAQLIDQAQFPGKMLDLALELKRSVQAAHSPADQASTEIQPA